MRTLLIDNYDSYTYNLFQLIAGVNGEEPVVVRNDEVDGAELDLSSFDNVVISPGPGHPAKAGDFGVSADVIARTEIPLLGVCLGHQGIVTHEGGEVAAAPAARHGHLAKVKHDGEDLFRDLPDDFTAVRYHSLAVLEPMPETLEATARADDGVVMGLRHRSRPLWGVQFHPESIATEYGERLIGNFRDLTLEHQKEHGTPARQDAKVHSGQTQHTEPATEADTGYRLHCRVVEHEIDTEAAFTELYSGSRRAFWLDSSHVERGLARFSYFGDDSGPLAEVVTYRVADASVEVHTTDGEPRRVEGNVFDYLKAQLRERVITAPELPFDFACGYLGYFGYELKAECGATNEFEADTPDASWMFVDRMVAVDHLDDRTYVLALTCSDGSGADAEKWLDSTVAALETTSRPETRPERTGRTDEQDDAESLMTRDRAQYLADVDASQHELHTGESYEICLTNSARVTATGNGYQFYRKLRQGNPAPYGAYLRFDGLDVACSSPERFLKVDREGMVETKPIKGTTPRGKTPEEDEQLRDSLATSAKTRAENLMIVDLLRNDLGRVCEVGTVHVPRLMATETYATVHQLVSTIRGQLRADTDVVDCVQACFPGGSMTGAPKLRTMEIIESLETEARGVYSGAIGFLGCNGTADLNIVIRTAVLADGEWRVGAGGAIVLDSDPVEEYEEMLLKARATLRAHARTLASQGRIT
jgi:para-aminobenzoate synthetase